MKNQKNGGIIPPVFDERVLHIAVGCNKCIECKRQKAREWGIRMQEEIKVNKNGKFIALTFSNESIKKITTEIRKNAAKKIIELRKYKIEKNTIEIEKIIKSTKGYELDNEIATYAVRRWLERYRKQHKKSIRHWLVTELGHNGTENIHIHGIIWTDTIEDALDKWIYGFTYPKTEREKKTNYVNAASINYIIKYVNKIDKDHKHYNSKILTSSGIGNKYNAKENKYNETETNETYRTNTGNKLGLPKYYRNKIYTDEEKEQLWINLLNKNERYVLGQRIDISKTEEEYYKILKTAQEKNKRLGYGTDKTNWKQKHYEETRREYLTNKRINNI